MLASALVASCLRAAADDPGIAPQPSTRSRIRRLEASVTAGAKLLRRAPGATGTLKVLKAISTWRPIARDDLQSSLHWAVEECGKLDVAWYAKKKLEGGPRRHVLLRIAGALGGQVADRLCTPTFGAQCMAQVGSRAMEQLRRARAHQAAALLWERLHSQVSPDDSPPWVNPWQTPSRFIRGLRSQAVWTRADLEADGPSAAAQLAAALEAGFPRILQDLQRIRKRRWPTSYGPELIRQPRNWTKVLLYDGDIHGTPPPPNVAPELYRTRELHEGLCRAFAPNTCEIISGLLPGLRHPDLSYLQPDHEQVAFFRLAPGSRIQFHQASQNARLTLHLCLHGCGGNFSFSARPGFRSATDHLAGALVESWLSMTLIFTGCALIPGKTAGSCM
eukprot:TRINITY_DN37146_c0_g1_i2.p1 TRINITY_DN37146_c0_g1~~TRINITY_DN37146_c0_g1_i2.p1  ORF type:complete len:390 (+),score=58.80 TRINITY_DN37146_c0_g1_i2:102-1271(+)